MIFINSERPLKQMPSSRWGIGRFYLSESKCTVSARFQNVQRVLFAAKSDKGCRNCRVKNHVALMQNDDESKLPEIETNRRLALLISGSRVRVPEGAPEKPHSSVEKRAVWLLFLCRIVSLTYFLRGFPVGRKDTRSVYQGGAPYGRSGGGRYRASLGRCPHSGSWGSVRQSGQPDRLHRRKTARIMPCRAADIHLQRQCF